MPEANYQDVIRNPYSLQNNEPGRDHGLFDVLGRAIRSTVPTRANTAFDPNAPVTDTNAPYQKPGFFRALAGDRGADMNRAAMMQGADVGLSKGLAGEQAIYHGANEALDNERKTKFEQFKADLERKFQETKDMEAWKRTVRHGEDVMKGIEKQAAGKRDAEIWKGTFGGVNARTLADGRIAAAQTPRQLDPSVVAFNNARTKKLDAESAQKQAIADRLAKPNIDTGSSLWDRFMNTVSGGANVAPAGIVRPPVSTGNPQTIGIPGTGPSPIGTAPGMPSTIKIDPMDLKALGIGVGSGLTQERNNGRLDDGMDQEPDDDADDQIIPMYGNGY